MTQAKSKRLLSLLLSLALVFTVVAPVCAADNTDIVTTTTEAVTEPAEEVTTVDTVEYTAQTVNADNGTIPSTGGALTTGTYTLTSDVTLTDTLTIASGQTVTIDLNGYTVSYTDNVLNDTVNMISNSGTLTITDNSTDGNGKLLMQATKTSDSTTSNVRYAGVVVSAGTLYLNGGTLEVTSVYKSVRIVTLTDSGSVSVNGANLIATSSSSRQTVYGIYAGSEDASVSVVSGSVTVECTNSSNTDGAVYGLYGLTDGCTVSMSGGTLSVSGYTTTTPYVNGIYGFTNTTVSDGTITVANNSSSTSGNAYGVRGKSADSYATITGGTITVTANGGTAYGTGRANITGGTITADKLLTSSVSGGTFKTSDGSVMDVSEFFASTDLTQDENGTVITASYVAQNTTTSTKYTTLQAAIDAAGDGDTVQPLQDLTEDITIASDDNIILDLAGYTLTGTGTTSVITVYGSLTLEDSSTEGTGTITGGVGTEFDSTSASIIDDGTDYVGGGVLVNGTSATATFTMNGGTITGNTLTATSGTESYGGGVCVVGDSATFTMNGGTISNNNQTTTTRGGGVCAARSATFIMNGGTISGNTAYRSGGVNLQYSATFTMNGGTISGNTSSNDGGGISVPSTSTFTMSGGTIFNNTAKTYGGGVYSAGNFTMSDGTISGNTAGSSGGGVYLSSSSTAARTFTMNGGTISNNTVNTSGGGGVYVASYGTFIMNDGIITGNATNASASSTTAGGGGVYVYYTSSTFTMNGGTISNNTAANTYGGGVYVYSQGSTFTMNSGTITANTALYGGGVSVYSGTFTLSGGVVTSNTATNSGGGVCARNNGTFKMTSGALYGNTATTAAADLYAEQSVIPAYVYMIDASTMTADGVDFSTCKWYVDASGSRYADSDTPTVYTPSEHYTNSETGMISTYSAEVSLIVADRSCVLGISSDETAKVPATIATGEGTNTMYVKVTADEISAYSTDAYPTTSLTYTETTTDDDGEETTVTHTYIFAGWYSSEDGTTFTACSSVPTDSDAYAKFVDADVLTVGFQYAYSSDMEEDGATDTIYLRLISTVDSLDYAETGFIVTTEDTEAETTTAYDDMVVTTVYKELVGMTTEYTPSQFSSASQYFSVYVIRHVPVSDNVKITVYVYWKTADGTRVESTLTSTFSGKDMTNGLAITEIVNGAGSATETGSTES